MAFGGKLGDWLSNPNALTMFRIAAAPGIVVLLLFPSRMTAFLAAILFSVAAISDYLDGYFARTRGMVSTFGKVMDPVADKLVVSSSFIMMVSHGWIPAWVVCVIIGRELAISGMRSVVAE
ncbi:MAG: CDP-diacylglycerol--glycerol-3-phosphate 3-phosphatidyltransferase, partial [Desulfococcaceae bacterium]